MLRSLILLCCCCALTASAYDPTRIPTTADTTTVDLNVHDQQRNRHIPLRLYLPAGKDAAPVVLFSHGLGGSRNGNPYLGRHWAARGYVVVFMQHHGSDENVWKQTPARRRLAALRQAANAQNAMLRFDDVASVIDQLQIWQGSTGHQLHGRLKLDAIGMSGHSFGAITTQAVSGQSWPQLPHAPNYTDTRITAAIAMSPNANPQHGPAKDVFAKVSIPWLLMTGTKDTAQVGSATMATRLAVFPALPAGAKYQLILHDGAHHAFSDHPLRPMQQARNPNHHRVILAFSTAFWDTYLRDMEAARVWLHGDGPQSVLEAQDRWEKK